MVNDEQKLTRVTSSRLTFVPYKARYVQKYHEWMKDERIQVKTVFLAAKFFKFLSGSLGSLRELIFDCQSLTWSGSL